MSPALLAGRFTKGESSAHSECVIEFHQTRILPPFNIFIVSVNRKNDWPSPWTKDRPDYWVSLSRCRLALQECPRHASYVPIVHRRFCDSKSLTYHSRYSCTPGGIGHALCLEFHKQGMYP